MARLTVAGFDQPKRVAALAYGPAVDEQWGQAGAQRRFLRRQGRPRGAVRAANLALRQGRASGAASGALRRIVLLDGRASRLHRRTASALAAEIRSAAGAGDVRSRRRSAGSSASCRSTAKFRSFPAVTRDLALVVKQTVAAQEVLDAFNAEKHANPLCGRSCKPLFYLMNIAARDWRRTKKALLSALPCKILNAPCKTSMSMPRWRRCRCRSSTEAWRANCAHDSEHVTEGRDQP